MKCRLFLTAPLPHVELDAQKGKRRNLSEKPASIFRIGERTWTIKAHWNGNWRSGRGKSKVAIDKWSKADQSPRRVVDSRQ